MVLGDLEGKLYRQLVRPILFQMEPEKAHSLVQEAGKILQSLPLAASFLGVNYNFKEETLHSRIPPFACEFENPVGLAAGFDKNAELVPLFYALGFGFIEVGSLTAQPRKGNPKPRMFRLEATESLINCLGLPNYGAEVVARNIQETKERFPQLCNFPLGINIAKTHDPRISGNEAVQDFLYSFSKVGCLADYVTLNVSCPNTREGKLFENAAVLEELLPELAKINYRQVPVLVKLSPHLGREELEKVLDAGARNGVSGYVIANTIKTEQGGLSGPLLLEESREMVSLVHELTSGKTVIIGVGGINSAESAYRMIRAGASLVQLYTGLVYQGPGLVNKINQGLAGLLRRDGLKNVQEAVGVERGWK